MIKKLYNKQYIQDGRFYLTKRYIGALTFLAILSVLAFSNMIILINSQYNDGKVINLSGQQVILSQKIALSAIYYQTEQLVKSIEEMEDNHEFLVSLRMSDELSLIYYKEPFMLDEKVRLYIENAKRFRETTDGKSLTYVLRNSNILLNELNKATEVYVKEAEDKVTRLRNLEVIICLATLITLLLEAIFIFKPANSTINRKTKELKSERDYLNTVIESSTNAIIVIDEELNIKIFNKRATEIFNYEKRDMQQIGDLSKIIPEKYKVLYKNGLIDFFKNIFPRLKNKTYEISLKNKTTEFPVRVSFGFGQMIEPIYVINIEDISEEKAKDTILYKQTKFAALGEMIAIIAHQWRQPLAELSLNNMYLKKKITQRDLDEELNKNEQIVKFMSETIASFETFYRKSDDEIFNPKESILQALSLIEYLLKLLDIRLYLEIDEELRLNGQKNSLSQVVLSLLQNSVDKHKMDLSKENKWVKILMIKKQSSVVINVEDNAGGISIKPIDSIFQSTKSTKNSTSTGLGLYMSKLVIEDKFNGKIEAENTKNGALFTITIPT